MEKINVLEVNNIDLPGRRFNGYDLLNELKDNDSINIKQIVIQKQSNNNKVKRLLTKNEQIQLLDNLEKFEKNLSIQSNLSITSPALINSKEYKEADIIHFHMFHNTKLSLISLIQICNEKKVIMSFHDPWMITGRCVHFGNCVKWKDGCNECENLNTLFSFEEDNCDVMWKLKEMIYKSISPEIVVPSRYIYDLVKESPITKNINNIHIIPLGVDLNFFTNKIDKEEARKKLQISNSDIVIFLRAQKALKGTSYVVEALKNLDTNKKITILTCDEKCRFEEVKNKYNIVDMGSMNNEQLLYAYNACDMFLMPSLGESFGMMAIEAMACEKPVVVFDNTALPSVTFAPECGVLVEDRNSNKLREAIEYLIDNEEERIKRGKLGRKICQENYSIDKYNNSLVNLYKKIANDNKKVQDTKFLDRINYNNEDALKIQKKLNEFTEQNFKENSKIYESLMFKNVKEIEGKIDYSNIEVQKIINKYNNDLYNIIEKEPTNNIFVQLKNAINLLIKDRDRLKNSIQYKIDRVFKKKD